MDERTPTATALAGARSLLSSVDHMGRKRLDAEARLALVTEVVALGRQVEALRAVLVAEADRARSAEAARGTSIKSLLAVSAKVTAGEAASWVYAGKDITAHPKVAEATLAGDVSVAQARAIDKVLGELPATLSHEQREQAEDILLDKAHLVDAKDLARQTRHVLEAIAPEVDAVEDELSRLDAQRKRAWAARSLVFSPDGDGSLRFRGQLPTLEGEAFKRLVEAHSVSNRRALEHAGDRHDEAGLRTSEQRTADGLVALVAARPQVGSARRPTEGQFPRTADASATPPSTAGRATSMRPTVVVTLSYDDLLERAEQAGVLAGGEQLTAGELRRLACDANVLPVILGSASVPLDVGREQRLVTPGIRRALEVRDQGCAFPGCRVQAHACEAHHITPWWAGGDTALGNLVLLCPHHHGTVEPLRFFDRGAPPTRWTVRIDDEGQPVFTPPRSRPPVDQTPLRPAWTPWSTGSDAQAVLLE